MVNYPRRKLFGCNYLGTIFLGGNCTERGWVIVRGVIVWGATVLSGNYPEENCLWWQSSRGQLYGEELSRGEVLGQYPLDNYPPGNCTPENCSQGNCTLGNCSPENSHLRRLPPGQFPPKTIAQRTIPLDNSHLGVLY